MEIQVRAVDSPEELAAVARLRYAVYVHEMGRRPAGCDDESEQLSDNEDGFSQVLAAYDGERLVGTVRLTPVDRLAEGSDWRSVYSTQDFPVDESRQRVISRLIVLGEYGGRMVAPKLLMAAYDSLRAGGGELAFLHCPPHLVALYEVMGFRRYREGFSHPEAGFRLPMVLIAGDWAHFEAVKSPLLPQVQQHPPNVSLGDWFERAYSAHSHPGSVRVLAVDEFLRQFDKRLTDESIPLLDDLDGEDTQRLFLTAEQIAASTGEVILRKGDGGTMMYLVLEGAVEVSTLHHGQRRVLTTLGAGQLFGEAAFLMQTPRSADVTAITDSLLLAISTSSFESLSENAPSVAVKLLRNLCRTLCLRLYASAMD
jgi:predicted GNAT family N-acyltransferase